ISQDAPTLAVPLVQSMAHVEVPVMTSHGTPPKLSRPLVQSRLGSASACALAWFHFSAARRAFCSKHLDPHAFEPCLLHPPTGVAFSTQSMQPSTSIVSAGVSAANPAAQAFSQALCASSKSARVHADGSMHASMSLQWLVQRGLPGSLPQPACATNAIAEG